MVDSPLGPQTESPLVPATDKPELAPVDWRNVRPAPAPVPAPAPAPAKPPVQMAAVQPTATPNVAVPQNGAPDPMANLARMAGTDVKTGAATIQKYLKDGGVGLNPRELAWCAAAMNASLAQVGLPGTGSQMALSFLKYGTPVQKPEHGDIVVLSRGGPNSGLGHVGYVDRINPDGSIRVLGGNQSQGVRYSNFPAADVLGYRRIPGAVAVTDPSQPQDWSTVQASAGGSFEQNQQQQQQQPAPAEQKKELTPMEQVGEDYEKGQEMAKQQQQQQQTAKLASLPTVTISEPTPILPKAQDLQAKMLERVPIASTPSPQQPQQQQKAPPNEQPPQSS